MCLRRMSPNGIPGRADQRRLVAYFLGDYVEAAQAGAFYRLAHPS